LLWAAELLSARSVGRRTGATATFGGERADPCRPTERLGVRHGLGHRDAGSGEIAIAAQRHAQAGWHLHRPDAVVQLRPDIGDLFAGLEADRLALEVRRKIDAGPCCAAAGVASVAAVVVASRRLAANRMIIPRMAGASLRATSGRFKAEDTADPQNSNAGPENRAGVAALGDPLRVTGFAPVIPETQRTGRRLTGAETIGASAR
jgi:hypothetical protein